VLPALGKRVYTTASTGVAGVAIGGTTLHSFAGVGLGDQPVEILIKKVKNNRFKSRSWQQADVLIVDEVSMLDAKFFDKLDKIGRAVRYQPKLPFGGIQLLLTGDFLQLPPVNKTKIKGAVFAFESDAWKNARLKNFVLEKVYRQEDMAFVAMLAEIRQGKCSEKTRSLLNDKALESFSGIKATDDGIIPTKLYATNRQVRGENKLELEKIETEARSFTASDVGDKFFIGMLQKNCTAMAELQLKVGAQVVLIKNLDVELGLCNGSRGVVDSFTSAEEGKMPVVLFANGHKMVIGPGEWEIKVDGEVKARRTQVPLLLAWALTIHKCQGMTLDRVVLSMGSLFEDAQAYVALSRCRSLEGLKLLDFDASLIRANKKAIRFYRRLQKKRERGGAPHTPTTAKLQPKPIQDASSSSSSSSKGEKEQVGVTLLPRFRPPADGWQCETCMVVNEKGQTACKACETHRPPV